MSAERTRVVSVSRRAERDDAAAGGVVEAELGGVVEPGGDVQSFVVTGFVDDLPAHARYVEGRLWCSAEVADLDIGLPLEHLRQPVRSCLTGEEDQQTLVVPAVNRKGRAIDCEVRVTPLLRGDQGQNGDAIVGVILLMDARDGTAGPVPPET
ncbi:MAG TPA: hypothetical protein VFB94_04275 [Acidimicrobiales bacterium]|nr:hypothetical protein [Acidimicrobiales bacterium]